MSWVIVGLLGAVALWYAGRLFGWLDEPPKSGGETTVSIDNPQKDDGVACSDALTDAEARRATSEDAAALEDNSDLSSGCTYLLGDGVEQLESGSLTVSRRIGMPAGKRTEFHGNTAVLITGESARTCGFAVFTAPDPVDSWLYVEVLLPSDRTGVCDVANNVTEAVFDNLPDA